MNKYNQIELDQCVDCGLETSIEFLGCYDQDGSGDVLCWHCTKEREAN
jgi:hypothetical protein